EVPSSWCCDCVRGYLLLVHFFLLYREKLVLEKFYPGYERTKFILGFASENKGRKVARLGFADDDE
ncbi:unnamed protein product, partial [Amoebophrya sp. A25]